MSFPITSPRAVKDRPAQCFRGLDNPAYYLLCEDAWPFTICSFRAKSDNPIRIGRRCLLNSGWCAKIGTRIGAPQFRQ
jgi:hypothetical protein